MFDSSVNSNLGTHASLPTEYDALTPEQTAALGRYRARWIAIRRSTEPADRNAAEEGVELAYRAAALKPPRRVAWCDGPVALSVLGRRISRDDGANVKTVIVDRIHWRVASTVARRVHKRVLAAVASVVSPADALIASAHDAVMQGVAQDGASLLERIRRAHASSWKLRALFGLQGIPYCAAGQQDFSWLAIYDYIRNGLGLRAETEALLGLWQLVKKPGLDTAS